MLWVRTLLSLFNQSLALKRWLVRVIKVVETKKLALNRPFLTARKRHTLWKCNIDDRNVSPKSQYITPALPHLAKMDHHPARCLQ
ncbi:hypothetical protein DPMN_076709 [Dreissena polymorpha]|uniref:Secreted protein n=1 Tax=Dreissena polymorpha TaxID=45954 RepID=A0A9D4BNX2_DREPO|nr:hypothetical protein DPMN_076709 [Dreissena polymorpha]